jgi:hypothetical protein
MSQQAKVVGTTDLPIDQARFVLCRQSLGASWAEDGPLPLTDVAMYLHLTFFLDG